MEDDGEKHAKVGARERATSERRELPRGAAVASQARAVVGSQPGAGGVTGGEGVRGESEPGRSENINGEVKYKEVVASTGPTRSHRRRLRTAH